jgi:serine/threonine-protein kinase RsbW
MHKTIVIQSSHDLVHKLCTDVLCEVKRNDFSQDDIFGIHLAIEEAMINAVKHGNMDNPLKHISVKYAVTPDKFEISITDEGSGFKPEAVPDPRCPENLYKVTGRGMLLMRAYMDDVEYNEAGNCVRMIKYKEKAKSKKL